MASEAAPPKRVVSSVFITLASPHRATVTHQQPSFKATQAPSRATLPGNAPVLRDRAENHPPAGSCGSTVGQSRSPEKATSPTYAQVGSARGKTKENSDQKKRSLPEHFPAAPSSPLPGALPSFLELLEDPTLLPPPSAQTAYHSPAQDQLPLSNKEVKNVTPPRGLPQIDERSHEPKKPTKAEAGKDTADLCGFCRKQIALFETAIEALNRTYHPACFECRSCHIPLAGKLYYNKAMTPICQECYQAGLELCWACGEAITDNIIHALERPYHPSCFTCTTCNRQIGEQTFAQGEVGDVYCLLDYYRKYAAQCGACNQLIIPREDGTDSYIVECLGKSYHENCFRCEVCVIKLPHEHGCYPLGGKLLCKPCHVNLVSGTQ